MLLSESTSGVSRLSLVSQSQNPFLNLIELTASRITSNPTTGKPENLPGLLTE